LAADDLAETGVERANKNKVNVIDATITNSLKILALINLAANIAQKHCKGKKSDSFFVRASILFYLCP
jgi:hypothetical protein